MVNESAPGSYISKSSIEKQVSRWHPAVQKIFSRDYDRSTTGVTFAYEKPNPSISIEHDAIHYRKLDVIAFSPGKDGSENEKSIHHEIAHALYARGILARYRPSGRIASAVNSRFERQDYQQMLRTETMLLTAAYRLRSASDSMLELHRLDTSIANLLTPGLAICRDHLSTAEEERFSKSAEEQENLWRLAWQVHRTTSARFETNLERYHRLGQPSNDIESLKDYLEALEEAIGYCGGRTQEMIKRTLTCLEKTKTQIMAFRGPGYKESAAESDSYHQIALLSLEVASAVTDQLTKKIAENNKRRDALMSRLGTIDERFARIVESLMTYHFGAVDLNHVRLGENELSALESIEFGGHKIFFAQVNLYRIGNRMVDEAAEPYRVQKMLAEKEPREIRHNGIYARKPIEYPFRIQGEIPMLDTIVKTRRESGR